MRRFIYKMIMAFTMFAGIAGNVNAQTLTADSVSMGPGYANEVYYSLANGVVASVPRNQWDIAFRTNIMSSGIITNDGAGVVLYTYPNADTSGWASIDTAGLSTWPQMFNDPTEWENGAFSRNATGHPDYGWGIYNEQTHNLTGDSIFIIKLRDGSFRKLWIMMKKSALDIYVFRFANLDGSNEQNVSLNLSTHTGVEFYGYDLQNNTEVNFQPPKNTWDILFTRYKGINSGQPYTVVGVLSNNYLKVKRFNNVPQSYNEWWVSDWDTTRSAVGYDWKAFVNGVYEVNDSIVYFIANPAGEIYKLYFTKFEGSSTGNIGFNIGKISSIGVAEKNNAVAMSISPNPVNNRLNIRSSAMNQGDVISIVNISGQTLIRTTAGGESTSIDVSSLSEGVYFVMIRDSNKNSISKKFVISR